MRSACSPRLRHSARFPAWDRWSGAPAGYRRCSRRPRTRPTWRWRWRQRWRSPRRSSCRRACSASSGVTCRLWSSTRCCRDASPRRICGRSSRLARRGPQQLSAQRCNPRCTRRAPCTTAHAFSRTSWRACADAASTLWGCLSRGAHSWTWRRWRRSPGSSSASSETRSCDAKTVEQRLVRAPVAPHPDHQLEVPLAAHRSLELAPACHADRLDHAPVRADQDPLLEVALDPDQRPHAHQVLAPLFDLLHDHLDGVWQLLEGAPDHGLSDQLRQQQLGRLIAARIRRVEKGTLGHQRAEVGNECRDALTGAGGDREHLGARSELRGLLERRHQLSPGEPVDLVDGHRQWLLGVRERGENETVAGADALLAVEDHEDRVRAVQLLLHATSHARRQRVAWALHPGQVDQHDLTLAAAVYASDRAPSRLWPIGDDRHLLPYDGVHERRLADVRPARQRHEAAARHRRACASSSSWSASISPLSVSWSRPSRCSIPWTIASLTSAVCAGQITMSPSSRGNCPSVGTAASRVRGDPPTSSTPSIGKERTSVGTGLSRCSALSCAIRSASTNSIATCACSIPIRAADREHSLRISRFVGAPGARPAPNTSTSSIEAQALRTAERGPMSARAGGSRWE